MTILDRALQDRLAFLQCGDIQRVHLLDVDRAVRDAGDVQELDLLAGHEICHVDYLMSQYSHHTVCPASTLLSCSFESCGGIKTYKSSYFPAGTQK